MSEAVSQPIRGERLIAICRVALAVVSLAALWLDPSEPARYAPLALAMFGGYVIYASGLTVWAWRARSAPPRVPLLVHVVDIAFFGAVIVLTRGEASPFFVCFVFVLAAATVRWQRVGTWWTAAAALALFVAAGWVGDEAPELNLLIVRSIHLGVVAALLAYLSGYQQRLRARTATLADWPLVNRPGLREQVEGLLEYAARFLAARRVLLLWEEAEEPWLTVASWDRGRLHWSREDPEACSPLAPEDLETSTFAVPGRRRQGRYYVLCPTHTQWRAGDPIPAWLRREYSPDRVLTMPISGETLSGRVYALDTAEVTADELILAEFLARRIALQLDQFALFERFRQSGLLEERIRFAADIHDGVIQSLTAATLRLETARQIMTDNPHAADRLIEDVQELIASEQQELRGLIRSLELGAQEDPADRDVVQRLQDLASRSERFWQLELEIHNALEGSLEQQLEHQVCRLVQEAAVNASRHGNASRATVELRSAGDSIRLTISDNGIGFPSTPDAGDRAIEPRSLKRRVELLGGKLTVASSRQGARLEITLPRHQATTLQEGLE